MDQITDPQANPLPYGSNSPTTFAALERLYSARCLTAGDLTSPLAGASVDTCGQATLVFE